MIEVKKTTYTVEGCDEPCWEVCNGYTMIRISPLYRIAGRPSILLTEYLDGEWNGNEEFDEEFDGVDAWFAEHLAKQFSCYI